MSRTRISVEAERDLDGIAEYTKATWGWRQAERYLTKLEEGIELLGSHPTIGRNCGAIRTGLRRFEVGSHVVFYFVDADGILVLRVLHQQMLPAKNV
ncbi:MAG: type II toxin-antitoxin system RelE/ParE family toxin [Terracidiphilus sp.]